MSRKQTGSHLRNIIQPALGIIFIDPPNDEFGRGRACWTDAMFSSTGLVKQTIPNGYTVLSAYSEIFNEIQVRFHDLAKSHGAGEQMPIKIAYFYEEQPEPGFDLVRRKILGHFLNTYD